MKLSKRSIGIYLSRNNVPKAGWNRNGASQGVVVANPFAGRITLSWQGQHADVRPLDRAAAMATGFDLFIEEKEALLKVMRVLKKSPAIEAEWDIRESLVGSPHKTYSIKVKVVSEAVPATDARSAS